MNANDLQAMIEKARGQLRPGVRMDPDVDQDILVGVIDGLGGGRPSDTDSKEWKSGIRIGREIAKALRGKKD